MNIKEILKEVQNNNMTIEKAQQLITSPLDYATIDFDREQRTGVPEVIYGEGKTKEHIAGIIQHMQDRGIDNILVTRLDEEKYRYLHSLYPEFEYDPIARTFLLNTTPRPMNKGLIVIACAGTSDMSVAKEAYVTASYLGNEVELISDVGVAGIHRLFNRLDVIQKANVVVAIAGMEGALASVIGGLTDKPVIAVPTSVGYGANFNGLAPLLAMLNSCASGISVVNIDNGFGAAYMAHSINNLGGKK